MENFEKNNVTIALNVSFAKNKKYILLISKCHSNCEKQVIFLMIANGERKSKSKGRQRNYLVVKKLLALLRGINSIHHAGFHFLNCLHSFAKEKKKTYVA